MDKAVDQCKNKDIRESDYLRFCCLLDFFQVHMEDLCDEYAQLYGNDEGICSDDIKKYFRYDMQRYKNNKKSLQKFGIVLTNIIENTDSQHICSVNNIMIKARERILQNGLMEIVQDYDLFLSFFENLFIFTQTALHEKIEQLTTYKDEKNVDIRRFFQTLDILSDMGIWIDGIVIKELFTKHFIIAGDWTIAVNPIPSPVFDLYCVKSENEIDTITKAWNHIYINWEILVEITAKKALRSYFAKILEMTPKAIEKEMGKELVNTSDCSYTKSKSDLLKSATRYAFILQYDFTPRRISPSKIMKWFSCLSEDKRQYNCYKFCEKHLQELKKVKKEQIELLFYYACIHSKK